MNHRTGRAQRYNRMGHAQSNSPFIEHRRSRSAGQALLLVVVMMGGILFLVTAVAGLLMYYQIQQSNDIANSTIAIFAADAALEYGLYHYFYEFTPTPECLESGCIVTTPQISFHNFAHASATIVVPSAEDAAAPVRIYGNGRDPGARTIRTLESSVLVNPSSP